jgi:YVTN family beta-propeller protein
VGSLWVLNPSDGIVTRIDADTDEVQDTIPLPAGSWVQGGGFAADEHGVWASWLTAEGNAVRIDPQSTAAEPVQIGSSLALIVDFAPAGRTTLWAHSETELLMLDPRRPDLADAGIILLGASGYGFMAADSSGVWLAAPDSDRVLHFTEAFRVDREVPVGDVPFGITTGHGAVWVANQGDGTVTRVDPESGEVVATIPVGESPWEVVVEAGSIWVDVHPTKESVSP